MRCVPSPTGSPRRRCSSRHKTLKTASVLRRSTLLRCGQVQVAPFRSSGDRLRHPSSTHFKARHRPPAPCYPPMARARGRNPPRQNFCVRKLSEDALDIAARLDIQIDASGYRTSVRRAGMQHSAGGDQDGLMQGRPNSRAARFRGVGHEHGHLPDADPRALAAHTGAVEQEKREVLWLEIVAMGARAWHRRRRREAAPAAGRAAARRSRRDLLTRALALRRCFSDCEDQKSLIRPLPPSERRTRAGASRRDHLERRRAGAAARHRPRISR